MDLIESVPMEDKVMHMSEITAVFMKHLKSKGLEYIDANKGILTVYGVFTILCLIIDLILYGATIASMWAGEPVLLCRI